MLNQEQLDGRMIAAVVDGNLVALSQALAGGANAKADDSKALWLAARHGHAECVKALIPLSDPLAGDSKALLAAALGGRAECARLLIPVSDPRSEGIYFLAHAAGFGHVECVKILIPVSDPFAGGSLALRWAVEKGRAECVRLLLPVSDYSVVDTDGLDLAALARKSGRLDVAGMIEAFVEAQALFSGLDGACLISVAKKTL